jgi:hypothetical protein
VIVVAMVTGITELPIAELLRCNVLRPDHQKKPFDDVRVRMQVVSLKIAREELNEAVAIVERTKWTRCVPRTHGSARHGCALKFLQPPQDGYCIASTMDCNALMSRSRCFLDSPASNCSSARFAIGSIVRRSSRPLSVTITA